jgi:hypothetical protein
MSNNYSMEYGYPSLIYPARMFKTREDAQNHDRDAALNVMFDSALLARSRATDLACGTVREDDEENCRTVIAALRWIVNAAEDVESAKRIAKWHAQNAKATIIAAEDECETGIALTQAINEVLAEDPAPPSAQAAE